MKNLDILDILLDEDNKKPIVLTDDQGKNWSFKQVAVIPYDNKVYAVLKPMDKTENIADDEAVVFYVDESGEDPVLMVESDEIKAMAVFDEYYNLIEKA